MSFYLYAAAGIIGGLLGGMGMGGGTLLIPILTIFLGVEQHAAQAANLIAFIPMSVISLRIHAEKGLLKPDGLWTVIIPAIIISVGGSFLAAYLPSDVLKKLFGAFLIALAVKQTMTLKEG